MNEEINKFGFFVADDNNKQRSSIWFVSSKNGSIYISAESIGGFLKLSIHPEKNSSDGKNCQIGLVTSYARKIKSEGYRAPKSLRWLRPITPEKGVVCVVSIIFPTDYLRGNIVKKSLVIGPKRKLKFVLPIAKKGYAVQVDIFYTKERLDTLIRKFKKINLKILGYFILSSNELAIITAKYIPFDSKMIPNLKNGHINPLKGAPKRGQSIKNTNAIMWAEPRDGSVIYVCEINGLTVKNDSKKQIKR
ncbi:MAG: hypothetical protein WC919_02510 [Candidatus Paceibacterota bacterium]|jgi:hypothetical protein